MHNKALLSDKLSAALQTCRKARRYTSKIKFTHTEHIIVVDDGKDFIKVKIDHIEIFDFIDDYFTEDCNFQDCLYQHTKDNDGNDFEVILVPKKYTFDSICKALLKVDKAEIEKMYAIKVHTVDNC